MDGNVEVDVDRQFRKEAALVVQVSCRRLWLLRLRLRVFGCMARLAGLLTGLRVVDVVVELDEGDENEQ